MSVKVAIRVRPFNQREMSLSSKCCVQMVGNKTKIKASQRDKSGAKTEYTFDYCFWSHDGFKTMENGLLVPTSEKYWDQIKVFQVLGKEMVSDAWEGYNCCLFAYGQTGAGKSYSMLGYGLNKGIVPLTFEDLFKRVKSQSATNKTYSITMTMIEIYNEKIQDLLIPASKRSLGGLEIRENKTLGVYVQNVTKCTLKNVKQMEKWMQEGTRNRSMASTLMNQYSSRAHTIITIEFVQREQVMKKQVTQKSSLIHLIDLAGSERVKKTGLVGTDRLKEASSINTSLHVLGKVIQLLAQKSQGKKKNQIVPYRQSSLTKFLQNSLGGNSKTRVICAISPATNNYQETISTLRYADQIKRIKNTAVVNQNSADKIIRQLKQENDKLKDLIRDYNDKSIISPQEQDLLADIRKTQKQIAKEIHSNKKAMESFAPMMEQQHYQENILHNISGIDFERLDTSHHQISELMDFTMFKSDQPYITNLNQDQILSGKVKYNIDQQLIIGRKNGDPKPHVILGAPGIQSNHAKIYKMKNRDNIFIRTYSEAASQCTFVNGENVPEREQVEIYHNDRIIFGTSCAFLLKTPSGIMRKEINEDELNFQFAIAELESLQRNKSLVQDSQVQLTLKMLEQEIEQEKRRMQDQINYEKRKFEEQLSRINMVKQKENQELLIQLKKREHEQQLLRLEKEKIKQFREKTRLLEEELSKERKIKQQLQRSLQNSMLYQNSILEESQRQYNEQQDQSYQGQYSSTNYNNNNNQDDVLLRYIAQDAHESEQEQMLLMDEEHPIKTKKNPSYHRQQSHHVPILERKKTSAAGKNKSIHSMFNLPPNILQKNTSVGGSLSHTTTQVPPKITKVDQGINTDYVIIINPNDYDSTGMNTTALIEQIPIESSTFEFYDVNLLLENQKNKSFSGQLQQQLLQRKPEQQAVQELRFELNELHVTKETIKEEEKEIFYHEEELNYNNKCNNKFTEQSNEKEKQSEIPTLITIEPIVLQVNTEQKNQPQPYLQPQYQPLDTNIQQQKTAKVDNIDNILREEQQQHPRNNNNLQNNNNHTNSVTQKKKENIQEELVIQKINNPPSQVQNKGTVQQSQLQLVLASTGTHKKEQEEGVLILENKQQKQHEVRLLQEKQQKKDVGNNINKNSDLIKKIQFQQKGVLETQKQQLHNQQENDEKNNQYQHSKQQVVPKPQLINSKDFNVRASINQITLQAMGNQQKTEGKQSKEKHHKKSKQKKKEKDHQEREEHLKKEEERLKKEEERLKQIESIQSKIEEAKKKALEQIKRNQEIMLKQQLRYQNQTILNQRIIQLKKKQKESEDLYAVVLKKQKILTQKKLLVLLPQVMELNLIAKEMNKNVEASVKIQYQYMGYYQLAEGLKNSQYNSKIKLKVLIDNHEEGRSYYWSIDRFTNRLCLAKDLLEKYLQNSKKVQILDKQQDPYWDPPEFQLIGQAYLSIQHLLYNLDYRNQNLKIIGNGHLVGYFSIHIYPTTAESQQNISFRENLEEIRSPSDLINKNLFYIVEIQNFSLSYSNVTELYIEYSVLEQNYVTIKHATEKVRYEGQGNKIIRVPLNYKKKHSMNKISEDMLQYITGSQVCFRIYVLRKEELKKNEPETESKSEHENSSSQISKIQEEPRSPSLCKSAIVENTEILQQIQKDYQKILLQQNMNKAKSVVLDKIPKKKGDASSPTLNKDNKDKEKCIIF